MHLFYVPFSILKKVTLTQKLLTRENETESIDWNHRLWPCKSISHNYSEKRITLLKFTFTVFSPLDWGIVLSPKVFLTKKIKEKKLWGGKSRESITNYDYDGFLSHHVRTNNNFYVCHFFFFKRTWWVCYRSL